MDRALSGFNSGGGRMGAKVRAFDWAATPIGPIEGWPATLRIAVDMMLSSDFPKCLFWGPELIAIYNDGYETILGQKPAALGEPMRVTWAEVWEELKPIADKALGGASTFIEDYPLVIDRSGTLETAYFTFCYSPVRDDTGRVLGMLDTVVETTGKVLADRIAREERERFVQLFDQSPTFMALLRGPEHVYVYSNPGYNRLIDNRQVLGMPVRVALPEASEQGYADLLDEVYRSGVAYSGQNHKFALQSGATSPVKHHYLDFVYQPLRNSKGEVDGILVEGVDVTDRRQAQVRREALMKLTEDIRDLEAAEDIIYAASKVLGEALEAGRVGYGTIDPRDDSITVAGNWTAAQVTSVVGTLNLRHFGTFVDDLKAGRLVSINDVRLDVRTAHAIDALEGKQALSLVNVPIVESDQAVAMLFINSQTPREWSEDETALIQEVAVRIRAAVERVKAQGALKALAVSLEAQVRARTAERNLLATVFESTDSFIHVVDLDYRWLAINKAGADEFERVFGAMPKVGDRMLDLLDPLPEQRTAAQAVWSRALAGEEFTAISAFGEADRVRNTYEMKFNNLYDDEGQRIGAYQVVTNINERIAAEQALQDVQEALRQSQKMEAVGHLTGGIAHDFNNMLAVVMGSLELLQRRLGSEDSRVARYIEAALDGARRAANLTQRLLAFSRQQPLRPEVLNVNRLVSGMSDLLRHSIGADIRLETVLAGGLWATQADPNQLENVILNLAVNARDAMPEGGRLTIETQNAHLDNRYVSKEVGVPPGHYVMIAITDTGSGMPADVIAKAFDPFFTTKAVGKGTGLGLSQVYGFIKQSGGHIKIYSEVGEGTTIKVYLPRDTESSGEVIEDEAAVDEEASGDQELILVVDDEPAVRRFSCDALTELGYRVVEADSAAAALEILKALPDIALIFTDIVMPDTNGRKLADAARAIRPEIKVLYTTGYTRNAVVHNGVVDAGVELIGKPFTIDELAARVRAILDGL
ncbi:GAF domain-containing hybrid sensor histidine kinase/response regulator [Asticcacaulis machinosus]|uniref:histidine kinase n=1 Tax=Asticcacaulis machinosus TaxID=2984211 RepID=A0ABT5HI01_9CAUL|nr:PAS domain-containing protein [Asticcacaulis machinosus]MDC7675822.1 PAS domain-containing protein [Asticcacaulis machinosus]